MWEAVPLALKKANTLNEFKKLYKAHLIACQSGNIIIYVLFNGQMYSNYLIMIIELITIII